MLNMITLIITTKMFNVPKHFWNPDLSRILASVYPRKGILCQCKIRYIMISFHGRFISLDLKKVLENRLLIRFLLYQYIKLDLQFKVALLRLNFQRLTIYVIFLKSQKKDYQRYLWNIRFCYGTQKGKMGEKNSVRTFFPVSVRLSLQISGLGLY